MLEKLKKGTKIKICENKAVVSSDIIKFKEFYYILADVIKNVDEKLLCNVYKIDDLTALIIRDKEKMLEMGFNAEERKAMYCHELGHCFSENQKFAKLNERNIFDEVDSDSFAVKKCDILPNVLESALAKSYEYEIKNINNKTNLTNEKLNRYVQEMTARKRNVEKLIVEYEKNIR